MCLNTVAEMCKAYAQRDVCVVDLIFGAHMRAANMVLCKKIVNSAENYKKNEKMADFMCVLQQNTCSDDFYHLYIALSVSYCSLQYSFYGV